MFSLLHSAIFKLLKDCTIEFTESLPDDDLALVAPLNSVVLKEVPKDATFTCEINRPNRKVTWLKDNKQLPIGKKYEFQNVGCVYTLIIHDATTDDVGKIAMKCAKITTEGSLTVESKCIINVEYILHLLHVRVRSKPY